MRSFRAPFRFALLGSALALAALTPAVAAHQSRADLKRIRAVEGNHPSALLQRSGAAQADPTYTDLHDFAGAPGDGADPDAGVTLDAAGNVYGTTNFGGANGDGAIFKLAPDGTQTGQNAAGLDGGPVTAPVRVAAHGAWRRHTRLASPVRVNG